MCFKLNTSRVNKDDCVVMALRVMSVVSERSTQTNKNRNVCGVIMAVRAVGGSDGRADAMSTEESMTLDGRKRTTSR